MSSGQRRGGDRGGWRKRKHSPSASTTGGDLPVPNSDIGRTFAGFRQQLDAQHDKHERLVKVSRDLTICSKRAIFALQRARLSSKDARMSALDDADKLLDDTAGGLLRMLATELQDAERRKYASAFSPGVQEYVEAITLRHFIATGTLLSAAQLEQRLHFNLEECGQTSLDLWPVDYLLGVADLSGELMRLAINSAGSGDCSAPFFLRDFVRELGRCFALLDWRSVPGRGLGAKNRVLRSTVLKMEMACYTLSLRGSEIPSNMLSDIFVGQEDEFLE